MDGGDTQMSLSVYEIRRLTVIILSTFILLLLHNYWVSIILIRYTETLN